MFELADYLSGIYKVEDCTSSVTIKNIVPTQMLPSSQSTQQTINGSENIPLSQMFDKLKSTQDMLRASDAASEMQICEDGDETIDGGVLDTTTTVDETIDGGNLNSTVDTSTRVVSTQLIAHLLTPR